MHCLLTALGSYGDVYPMIGLGAALRGRGHDVTLVTNPHFASDVAAAGLDLVELATAEEYDRLTLTRGLWGARSGLAVVFREAAIGLLQRLDGVVRAKSRPGETLLVAHGLDLASRVAAEELGMPAVSVVYAPMALWSDETPPRMPAGFAPPGAPRWLHKLQFALGDRTFVGSIVMKPLNEFRASHGLPPIRGSFLDWYYGVAPALCLFPDWFASPDGEAPGDWPHGTVTTGFPLGDGAGGRDDEPLSDALNAFLDADDPPIVFTPGSGMRFGHKFFEVAIDACQRLGRRGVLLTKYADQLPARLPSSIIAPGFTPLAQLLERSAAFVHHGGVGSSARGLAAGVPQLVQPKAFDQFDNAWRLRRLGVAEELTTSRFKGRRVAERLERLLTSSKVTQAVKHWQAKCDSQEALRLACEELERRFESFGGSTRGP
ncbi:glycosyltransferase [Botrimarina mediterranea]|uniref:MurG-like transferase n=1 Tax=Botrimarina mediterranea TaxID=2528022 RepID=A0A518KCL4_9BACT|nr:glycosyltransferase [Botrimarina mediterranea]QDV75536.1 MurG-like transferase [Botrimarina mediterranea]QDV80170.1 MurG-like transferase [Planctomycetes bacterium K2D]